MIFVSEVLRKTVACIILLITDFFLFLCILNIRLSKLFLEIGVPLLCVLSGFIAKWIGKKYWRNQKMADMLSKAFFVLLTLMVLFGIICIRITMKE